MEAGEGQDAPQHAPDGSVSLEGPGFATGLVQNLVKVPVPDDSPNIQASVCSVTVRLNALKVSRDEGKK